MSCLHLRIIQSINLHHIYRVYAHSTTHSTEYTLKVKSCIHQDPLIHFKISSLYSPYYAEACSELRGPSPRLSTWATQLRRNVATVASRWRHCVDLTSPGIEPQTSRTDSVRLATELTAGSLIHLISQTKMAIAEYHSNKFYAR